MTTMLLEIAVLLVIVLILALKIAKPLRRQPRKPLNYHLTGPTKISLSAPIIYSFADKPAQSIKAVLQMAIGVVIGVLLFRRGIPRIVDVWENPDVLFKLSVLEIVEKGLAYTAGIELIYMLFTDGPDEALVPPLMGIAAAVLVVVSKIEPKSVDVTAGLTVLLLVLAILVLFVVRQYLNKTND